MENGNPFQLRITRQSAFTASAVSTSVIVGQFFQDKLRNGETKVYNLPQQPMEITLFYKVSLGKDIVTKLNIDPRGFGLVEIVFSYKMTAAGFIPLLMFFQPTARIDAKVNYFRNPGDSVNAAVQQPNIQIPPTPGRPARASKPTPPAEQPRQMKFCPHCGFRLPADAKFCSKCGKPQPNI